MQYKKSLIFTISKVLVLTSLLMMLSFAFQVKVAMAHAALIKSDPPRRATLSTPPKQIQLWFNEKIEGSYASVTVRDSNKNSVTENTPESVTDDPKSVVLSLPPIESGRYTVHYRVMSVDGHVIESSFDFSIKNKM